MSMYLIPIQAAVLLFPLLAACITIPYIIYQYRHYGSLLFLRVAVVYSFIFYLLCAYFLVILPLPPIEEVRHYTQPIFQLVPFRSLMEFSAETSLVWNDPSTYLRAFNEPSLYLILFNIILTIPFGIYLRYYFNYDRKKTVLCTFLLTLSFECLQASALFGIYPRPYRLFDVDDLITNTLGGMLGYAITPLFARFLPSRKKLDEEALEKGRQVSSLRRVTAFFADLIVFVILCFVAYRILTRFYTALDIYDQIGNLAISYGIAAVLCLWLIPVITKGKTLGKALVKIKLVREDDRPVRWYQYPLHYGLLYGITLPAPLWCLFCLLRYLHTDHMEAILWMMLLVLLAVQYVTSLIQCIRMLFSHDITPLCFRLTKVKNVSTIPFTQEPSIDTPHDIRDDEKETTAVDVEAMSNAEAMLKSSSIKEEVISITGSTSHETISNAASINKETAIEAESSNSEAITEAESSHSENMS